MFSATLKSGLTFQAGIGSGNPTDEDLARFRAQGFSSAVSLLEEGKQPSRYDRASAQAGGWSLYSIPIEEGSVPSLEQIREFIMFLKGLPEGTKVLVFCESGLGRTAFMGAAYWIAKGLSASDAIARMSQACRATDWATQERQRVLTEYERSMKGETDRALPSVKAKTHWGPAFKSAILAFLRRLPP